MSQAYHQGQISEESRKFTAFSTPWSLYEWVRIPYGLTNAPPCFQRYMNDCLYHLRDRICIVYLDDILIYGRTFEEHQRNVETVIKVLIAKGIKLNPKKCTFAKTEVRYLGRLISQDGYRPDPENTVALNACKTPPKNVGQVRTVLGFLGYYRNFVKDFSRKMKPIYELLKSEGNGKKGCLASRKTIKWLPEHQKLIEDVVEHLQSPEVIAYPDFAQPFIVHCDASETGLGAVLYQRQEGKLRVVSFASRTLTPAERNYHMHSGKLEFLALKWCVTEKFSDYLHHGPPFEVFTDNNPLTYILTTAKLNATGLRWVARLADFTFSIKYRAGKKHIDADYLSRHPVRDFENHVAKCDKELRHDDICLVLTDASKKKGVSNVSPVVDVNELTLEEDEGSIERVTSEELSAMQQQDSVVGPVFNAVVDGRRLSNAEAKHLSRASRLLLSQFRKLSLVNGVLMRNTSKSNQIVLPKAYHQLVYRELHQKMGHLGSERVVELARKRFYWPYMQRDIEFFVQKKCRCVVDKQPNTQQKAKLVPIEAQRPFELVSIDYTHLDPCKGGYEQVLVVVDHFTRFVQFFPTKNKSARSAADQIFNKYILNYGFPRRIHHDQGKEFNNSLFDRLHQLSGISGSRTTPYHPEGDGQPERTNRTLENMLKCLGEKEKSNWKDHLASLAFAYNSTVNKVTGYSPFYLMFGRESRLPIDLIFGIEIEKPLKASSYDQYVRDWQTSMKQAVEIAQKNIAVTRKYNEKNYNKKVKLVNEIVVGDYVLLRNRSERGGTGKLRSHWEDVVYKVIEKDSNLPVYTIQSLDGKKPPKRVHRNNIMCCNYLPFKNREPEKNNVPVKSKTKPLEKPATRKIKRKNIPRVVPVPIPSMEEETSSDDDIVVVRRFSVGEEVEETVEHSEEPYEDIVNGLEVPSDDGSFSDDSMNDAGHQSEVDSNTESTLQQEETDEEVTIAYEEEGDYIPPEQAESEPETVQEYDDSVSESDLREETADGSSSDSEEEQPR